MNKNVPILGLLLGLVFPFLGVLLMYFLKFNSESLGNFFGILFHQPKIGAMVFSLGLIANLVPFLYLTNKRLDLTARGVLVATMLYAVLIILLRFELFK